MRNLIGMRRPSMHSCELRPRALGPRARLFFAVCAAALMVAQTASATPPDEDEAVTPLDARESDDDVRLSTADEPPEGAPLWLSVSGGVGSSDKGLRGLGMLTIGGAFDRVAHVPAPSRAKEGRSPSDSHASPKLSVPDTRLPTTRLRGVGSKAATSVTAQAESERLAKAEPAPEPSADKVTPATSAQPRSTELPNEPPPIEPRLDGKFARGLVRAVRARSGNHDTEERLEGLSTRARASALLPEVRLRVARVTNDTQTLSPTSYDPTRVTASGATGLWIDGRATFRLDRLVFADEEIAVERLRTERARMERALTMEVLAELALWQRGAARAADPTLADDDRVTGEIAQLSAAAALDVLSDGWFSAHLPREK
jgi:hypothetical protein